MFRRMGRPAIRDLNFNDGPTSDRLIKAFGLSFERSIFVRNFGAASAKRLTALNVKRLEFKEI